ncbi:MAG: N-acetylmuramoyl-L-alanine amidase [Muribaculaceae bacterium]|nr:N-acetylmuramoyl-L-alanine amidase [Muribaculaceae bacterium]
MKKISYIIALVLVAALSFNAQAATKWTNYKIMLDPGHGGSDPGAQGPSAPHEATLVLRCGNALKNRIVNECSGTVKMTRSTDVFISLSSRRSSSVSYDPYIFCSIHLNAYNKSSKGTETYYYWSTGNSNLLANKVQAQLIAQFKTVSGFTPTNRGVKYGNLAVIKGSSSVPAILTEGLFVDNSTEWGIINTESKDGFKKWVQGHLYGFYDRLVLLKSDIVDPSDTGGSTTTTPSWTINPTSLDFTCVEGNSATNSVTIKGSNLTAAPTATISGTGFSIASKSLKTGTATSTVTIQFSPTSAGSYSGTLTLKSGSLSKTVKLTGTASAKPLTFTEKWNFSDQSGTLTKKGWDAGKVRNMTYNAGKLYLVYNHSDIKVVNAQDGTDLGNLNKAGVEGGTLTLCDVKYFDGKVVACNLAVTGQELKLYVWDDDQQNPRVLLKTTDFGGATRIGDYLGFYGTWSSGKVVFGHYASDATRIISYAIKDGVCSTTPTIVKATTDGSTILNTGGSTRVYPGSDYYWIDGKNNHTTRLDANGARQYYIDTDETWGTAFQTFTWKGTEYGVAMTFNTMEGESWSVQTDEQKAKNYTGGRMVLFRNDSGWNKPTVCEEYPEAGLSSTVQNTNCTGNVIAAVNGTSGVEAWVLSTGQGIGYYLHGTAPTYSVSEITPATPTVKSSKSSVSLTATVGETATSKITVSGTSLEGDITLALSGVDASMFSISSSKIAQATASGSITITYAPTLAGSHTATLTISSTGAPDAKVTLKGTATEKLVVTGAEIKQDWAQTSNHITVGGAGRCWSTAFDGKIYFNDYANSKLYYWTKSGITEVGASAAGAAITSDDAGNIIINTTLWSAAATSFKILPAGSTTFQDLTITLPDGMTTNQLQYLGKAVGNVMNSKGGALFLFPNTSTNVAKIIIQNGAQSSAKAIPVNVLTADAQSIAVPLTSDINSDAIAVRVRAQKHFYYHNGTEFVAYPDNGINTTQGGTLFTLNETLYAVEPIGTPAYLDGFQVVDITNNKVVATHAAELTEAAYKPNPNSITAEIVGDYEAKLYQYIPGQLAAQYTFTLITTVGVEDVAVDGGEGFEAVVYGDELQFIGIEADMINVYNVAGVLVASGNGVSTLDISTLAAGIYVVQVKDTAGNIYSATIKK